MGEMKEKHCNVKRRKAEIQRLTFQSIERRFGLSVERGKNAQIRRTEERVSGETEEMIMPRFYYFYFSGLIYIYIYRERERERGRERRRSANGVNVDTRARASDSKCCRILGGALSRHVFIPSLQTLLLLPLP